ncbi:MAG: hypothetical protein RIC55_18995 [Pirellulaceae bacterium]
MIGWWIAAGVAIGAAVMLTAYLLLRRRAAAPRIDVRRARQAFQQRREWLEAHFVTLASQSGRPRGLTWIDCDFDDAVALARDRHSGDLRALVSVAIRFEAVAGGPLEDNPNVGNIRAATAVFRFDGDQWRTDGRALFNLNPSEAIEHFQHELEVIENE